MWFFFSECFKQQIPFERRWKNIFGSKQLYVHDSAPSPSASESERHQEIDEMNRQGLIHHVTQATRQQQQEQLQELEQATQSIPPVPCGSDYDDDLDELAIFGDDNFEYLT